MVTRRRIIAVTGGRAALTKPSHLAFGLLILAGLGTGPL